jgi:hypothetical protein
VQVILPVLFGFLLRIKSFNELSCMLKENEFKMMFLKGTKMPKIDTIRDTLKIIYINGFTVLMKTIIKKAIDNKTFAKVTIGGYIVQLWTELSCLVAIISIVAIV